MIEPQTRKFDELEVTVQAWPARKAWKYQLMFGKIFGPSLKELGAAFNKSTGIQDDFDISKLGEAFGNLFEKLSETEAEDVLMKCMSSVRVNNQEMSPEIFDTVFQGKMSTVYKIVFFVLEVNYDFLGEGGIGQLLKKNQIQ